MKSQSAARQPEIYCRVIWLSFADVYSLKTFFALLYLKGNLIALIETLVPGTGDG
jgi:hypothetical protein